MSSIYTVWFILRLTEVLVMSRRTSCSCNSWKRGPDLWRSICPDVCQSSRHCCMKYIHAAGMFAAMFFFCFLFLFSFFFFQKTAASASTVLFYSSPFLLLSNNTLEIIMCVGHIYHANWTLMHGSNYKNVQRCLFEMITLRKTKLRW